MGANVKALRTAQAQRETGFINAMKGVVTGLLENGLPVVAVAGQSTKFIVSRSLQQLASSGLASGTEVLIACDEGYPTRAILLGVVTSLEKADVDVASPRTRPAMARLDGRSVVLEADSEIVLRCGKGSLTLTADGRIVMKGVEITSRALRKHKIKGGTVDIN